MIRFAAIAAGAVIIVDERILDAHSACILRASGGCLRLGAGVCLITRAATHAMIGHCKGRSRKGGSKTEKSLSLSTHYPYRVAAVIPVGSVAASMRCPASWD